MKMAIRGNKLGWGMVLGLMSITAAGAASAECMMPTLRPAAGAKATDPAFVPAVFHPDSAAGSMRRTDFFGYDEGIVGLWQFKFYSGGTLVDWGTQAWHADGTELTFSGGQNPETGDVCQGVWRQVGKSTYTLNHLAMGPTTPGGPFDIRVHLHFKITLNSTGTEFTGTFTEQAYAVSAADPFDESSPEGPLVTAQVVATRVVPD
jgi:hypothetical protein